MNHPAGALPGDGVLERGKLGDELCGLILLRYGRVLRRESIAVEAEVAHPQLRAKVNLK